MHRPADLKVGKKLLIESSQNARIACIIYICQVKILRRKSRQWWGDTDGYKVEVHKIRKTTEKGD